MEIRPIDLGYLDLPGAAEAFLLLGAGSPILMECGPEACRPVLERGIRAAGVDPASISDLFVTHIHLDHAGAAGSFAARGSRVHVHPIGAPHLVDPRKLIASSRRVHGVHFDRYYGEPIPSPPDRVHAVADLETVAVGGLRFTPIDTPGHARHHHAWLVEDGTSRELFAGDVVATRVPGSGFIAVPTPPPEYDVRAWLASLERLRNFGATRLWLTHGGAVRDPLPHLMRVSERLIEENAIMRSALSETNEPAGAMERYGAWLRSRADAAGVAADLKASFLGPAFLRMNLAGVARAIEIEQRSQRS